MPIIAAALMFFLLWALSLGPDEMPDWFAWVLPLILLVVAIVAGMSIHDYASRRGRDDHE